LTPAVAVSEPKKSKWLHELPPAIPDPPSAMATPKLLRSHHRTRFELAGRRLAFATDNDGA